MEHGLGFAHFIGQADALALCVLVLLLLLSTVSWYQIVIKAVANLRERRRATAFLENFWRADTLQEVSAMIAAQPRDNAFADLAQQALAATKGGGAAAQQKFSAAGGLAEFLSRLMQNRIDQEAARIGRGLAVLAAAGSSAPYIGLFGTVWGIYHALINIGLAGEGTLDKVSGPVGEALIMTALGLAVAIPAVLALSAFNRRNRMWLSKMDAFAHDLYAVITVGEKANSSADSNAGFI
jgi:biopolymer transport protein ExbB